MRLSAKTLSALLFSFSLFISAAAFAQQGAISIDHVSCVFHGDTVLVPSDLRITLRYTNNTERRVDISNGFRVHTTDGAFWDSTTVGVTDGGTFASYFDVLFHLGVHSGMSSESDTVGLLGAGTTTSPIKRLPDGYSGTPVTITLWNIQEFMDGKHICIDTAFYNPGGSWKWVSIDGETEYTYYPTFTGLSGQTYTPTLGYCFTLYNIPCATARDRSENIAVAAESGCPCSVCCVGTTGNVNDAGIVDLGDLSALVSYLTGGGYVLPCEEEANINNVGIIDLSDLSALVSYLTGGGYSLLNCP